MTDKPSAPPLEWLFFDIGNVLFNDDRQTFYGYRALFRAVRAEHPEFTFADLLAQREQLAREGLHWILQRLAGRWFSEEQVRAAMREIRKDLLPRYDEYNVPHAGMCDVLDAVRGRYRLGVIANQPRECRGSLERRGILHLFEVVAISEELDLHKPDVRLYEWALQQAACLPAQAAMIGDRLDNDIAPAKGVGMRTLHLAWPNASVRGWQPDCDEGRMFLQSCDRVPVFHDGDASVSADVTVALFEQIVDGVAMLDR